MPQLRAMDWWFLAYMGVWTPYVALRTRGRIVAARSDAARVGGHPAKAPRPLPSVSAMLASTIISLASTGALAWYVGHGWEWPIPPGRAPYAAPTGVSWLVGVVALTALLGGMLLHRRSRSETEQRTMPVLLFAPRTPAQGAVFALTAVAAGVAEEIAWRGTFWALLTLLVGTLPAAILSSGLFAVAHALQGWKSMLFIFATALLMHGVVWTTGTLVVAMGVHTVFDCIAGIVLARRVRRYELEARGDSAVA